MKLLLYCTKGKPYLSYGASLGYRGNGKIVAECDFEVEEITAKNLASLQKESCMNKISMLKYLRPNLIWDNSFETLLNAFGSLTLGYAIHIKNLKVFDEPKELNDVKSPKTYEQFKKDLKKAYEDDQKILDDIYLDRAPDGAVPNSVELLKYIEYEFYGLKKAPQNMMYVYDGEEKKVLISIRPKWMCKILNGEKTIEVRKKVLKEMLKNEIHKA